MIRYRRSLNHKLCRLGIGCCPFFGALGTLREIKVFGFWGDQTRRLSNSLNDRSCNLKKVSLELALVYVPWNRTSQRVRIPCDEMPNSV
ncbi:hypothetical protein PSN45_002647 [Yamadazyma tenuis]|nr:hypothetical protein PSN45_002647 [Yamadazyma tenuis]